MLFAGYAAVQSSPRLSFYTLVAACSIAIAGRVQGQQPPSSPPADSARPRGVQRLAPQRITGTRLAPIDSAAHSTAAHVDVISAADVRRVAPGPGQTAQLLARLNGVSVFDDQGTRAQPTLDLRGWTLSPVVGVPQGVSVFLDGVRVNEADAQEVNFDLIPEDAIASASVIRGPAALYGKNTLAGAVLLTTRRGYDDPGIDAGVSAGRFGFREGKVVGGGTTASPLGQLDGLVLVRGSSESGYRVATDASTRLLFANFGRRASGPDGSDVALSILWAHDKLYQAGSLPESWLATDPEGNYTPGDFFAPDLLHVTLRGSRPLGITTLRGNAFVRQARSEQFNVNVDEPSSRANVAATTVGSTMEWDVPMHLGGRVVGLAIGGELSHDLVKYRVLAEPTAAAPDLPADCDASGLCENARVNNDNGGLFTQLTIPLIAGSGEDAASAPLTLTLAARGDWVRIPLRDLRDPENDGTTTYRRGSPRVALAYHSPSDATLYAAVSTGYRAPAPLELACADQSAPCLLPFSLGDDPPLAPVTVLNYETGATWSPLPWLLADVSVYASRIRNEIVFAASSRTAGFFQNIPHTSRDGLELSLRAERRRAGTTWRAFGQYSYVDARYGSTIQLASALPDEPAAAPGDRMPLSPAHRATLGIGATTLRHSAVLDGELRVRGVSSQFLRGDEANTQPPLAGYATVGAHLSVRLARVQLSIDANNLLDRRFVTFGTYAPDVLAASPGGASQAPVARFLTPGYPRSLTLTFSTIW